MTLHDMGGCVSSFDAWQHVRETFTWSEDSFGNRQCSSSLAKDSSKVKDASVLHPHLPPLS